MLMGYMLVVKLVFAKAPKKGGKMQNKFNKN
jgi:hypothetical protein